MAAPDYQSLIDRETWAFIARTAACYPDDTASCTVADQRRIYDAMCAVFHRGHPPGITASDEPIAGVPCRRYRPAAQSNPDAATVIYLHGGGFVVGGLHSHDDVCAEICATTGLCVISVDYRLSPEHLHPAAFDDACAVVRAVPGPLVLAGDSAGGTLAATAAHALRGDARLRGLVLVYAGLGGDISAGSYVTHAEAPMLTTADVAYYGTVRFAGPAPEGDPTASPLADKDFSGLPPVFALCAECDPVCDDAHVYAARIRAAGGRAVARTEPGLVHGYLRARATVPRARASFARMTRAIAALSRNHWPEEDLP